MYIQGVCAWRRLTLHGALRGKTLVLGTTTHSLARALPLALQVANYTTLVSEQSERLSEL